MSMQAAWAATVVAVLCGLPITPVAAVEAFVEISTTGIDVDTEQRQRYKGVEVDWVRRVQVNPAALSAREISVDLYDLTLLVTHNPHDALARSGPVPVYSANADGRVHRRASGGSDPVWTGVIARVTRDALHLGPGDEVVRVWATPNGTLRATFNLGRFRYELDGDALVKHDRRRIPNDDRNDVRDVRPVRQSGVHDNDGRQWKDNDTIRIVVGLGAGAVGENWNPVIDDVRAAKVVANEGAEASSIGLVLDVPAYAITGYPETSLEQTLDDVLAGPAGPLWLLHRVREIEQADVMVMVVDTGTLSPACGSAQQILATRETAFAAVERRCLKEHSLAHEIGHLLGADHNTEDAVMDPPRFAYGHGYRAGPDITPRWRTVMGQECPDVACERVNLWSSPLIHHSGQPAGTVDTHDNARVLRETKAIIAGFYEDP